MRTPVLAFRSRVNAARTDSPQNESANREEKEASQEGFAARFSRSAGWCGFLLISTPDSCVENLEVVGQVSL